MNKDKCEIAQSVEEFYKLAALIKNINSVLSDLDDNDEETKSVIDIKVFYLAKMKEMVTQHIHSWPPETLKSANEYLESC